MWGRCKVAYTANKLQAEKCVDYDNEGCTNYTLFKRHLAVRIPIFSQKALFFFQLKSGRAQ